MKDIWEAGQGVGTIMKIQSIKEVVNELHNTYEKAINDLSTIKR